MATRRVAMARGEGAGVAGARCPLGSHPYHCSWASRPEMSKFWRRNYRAQRNPIPGSSNLAAFIPRNEMRAFWGRARQDPPRLE